MVSSFIRNRKGASATEFAVIAPVLAFMALGMIDGWSLARTSLDMQAAIPAGASYVLTTGGGTESTIEQVAMSAWVSAPMDGDIVVTKACTCAGAAASCSGTCPVSLKPPVTTYTITATGTWTAPFEVNFLELTRVVSQSEVVRVK